jgi:hypothetical protein
MAKIYLGLLRWVGRKLFDISRPAVYNVDLSTSASITRIITSTSTAVLSAFVPKNCSQPEQQRIYEDLKLSLGAITTLFSALSAGALSQMLEVSTKDLLRIFSRLHSILDVSEDSARPLRLHHDSFRDFLSDKTRCQDSRLFVNKKEAHARLVKRCIKVMSSALKEDVCGQRMLGVRVSDVSISHIQ